MADSPGPGAHGHCGTKRSASALTLDTSSAQNKGVEGTGPENPHRLWACPFYKFDPFKYQSCLKNTLTAPTYVRQHLFRAHYRDTTLDCPRCGETKDSRYNLHEHMREGSCSLRGQLVAREGLTADQVDTLKERKGTWEDIWRVTFPQISPPPPPFVASTPVVECLNIFRSFIRSQNEVEGRLMALLSDIDPYDPKTTRNLASRIMDFYDDVISKFQSLESLPIDRYRSSLPSIVLHPEDTVKDATSSPPRRPVKIPRLPTPARSEATSDNQTQAPSRSDAASSVDAAPGIQRGRLPSPGTDISRSSLALPSPRDNVGAGPVGQSSISTGLLLCPHCESTRFSYQHSLTRHIREVHSSKHLCPFGCGYSARKDNIKRHVLKKHGGQALPADSDAGVPGEPRSNLTFSTSSYLSSGTRGQEMASVGGEGSTGNARHNPSHMGDMQATMEAEENFGWAKLEAPKPTPVPMPQVAAGSPVDEQSALSRPWQLARRKVQLVYNYDECQLLPEQVRLLVLRPSTDKSADLVVELRAFSVQRLADSPDTLPYTALSYAWGTAEASQVVYVDSTESREPRGNSLGSVAAQFANRKRLHIKPSLDSALRQLRQQDRPIALWVDAICVNQASSAERADQVRLMGKIFSFASTVLVWLGPPDEDRMSDMAMGFIGQVLRLPNLEEYLKPRYAMQWSYLLKLLQRKWFSRAWIMQEIPVARDVVVQCGDSKTHWMDFSDAVSLFSHHFDTILSLIKGESSSKISVDEIQGPDSIAAIKAVDTLSLPGIFHYRPDGSIYKPRQRLETLLYTSTTMEAPDPRDKIFGLFGLTTDKLQQQPDYSLTLREVYSGVVESVVKESRSLDIICRPWALPELKEKCDEFYPSLSGLPSWVPVWRDPSQPSIGMGSSHGIENTFVGGVPERRRYFASGDEPAQVNFGKPGRGGRMSQDGGTYRQEEMPSSSCQPRQTQPWWERARAKIRALKSKFSMTEPAQGHPQDLGGALRARGVFLGIVTWQERMDNGMISSRVLSHLGHNAVRDQSNSPVTGAPAPRELDRVPPALWRTLVADRGPDGGNPPSWYHRACLTSLAADIKWGKINTGEVLARERGDSMKARYLRRVRAVCSGRAYLECLQPPSPPSDGGPSGEEGGEKLLHGVGPADVQVNDYVCVLFGCSVPVILRPYSLGGGMDEDEELPQYYKLVGEAFVLGMMNGEAVDHLQEEDRMEFVIV